MQVNFTTRMILHDYSVQYLTYSRRDSVFRVPSRPNNHDKTLFIRRFLAGAVVLLPLQLHVCPAAGFPRFVAAIPMSRSGDFGLTLSSPRSRVGWQSEALLNAELFITMYSARHTSSFHLTRVLLKQISFITKYAATTKSNVPFPCHVK